MIFKFAEFELDLENLELRQRGVPRPVEPQVFDLLRYLIEHRGRVVSREELFESIWAGRIVSEATLSSRIKAVRQALGDTGKEQRLVQTVPRRGFRFVAAVGESASDPLELIGEPEKRFDHNVSPPQPSIAVLPFENLSSDPEQEYFVDGIAEELITELARFRWLRVVARNSSFTYKNRVTDIRRVAEELDVAYVVEGSVRKASGRVRVTAQLIDGKTANHIWAERYERSVEDIFALQDELTNNIAVALSPELFDAEAARSRTKAQNLTSWDLFLRARDQHYAGNAQSNAQAIDLARRAIELDPGNVGALYIAATALYMQVLNSWTPEKKAAFDEALIHAERAVLFDRRDARGHRILGLVYLGYRRHEEALRALETAVELNSSYPEAMVSLGTCCFYTGHAGQGVTLVERAIALSPRDPEMTFWRCTLSLGYLLTGQYEKGIESAKYCATRKDYFAPSRWYWAANGAYAQRPEEIAAARAEVLRLNPEFSREQIDKLHPFKHRSDFEILANGLAMAGLFGK